MDLEANLREFLDGRNIDDRYASFDFCFNYFQSFRESGDISALANQANLQMSCLQLGFYLASWGMFRGSTTLLQKSAHYFKPVIEMISSADPAFWELDAHVYTEPNIERLLCLAEKLRCSTGGMSDTLVTKIMIGVFGNVPAFDTNFIPA